MSKNDNHLSNFYKTPKSLLHKRPSFESIAIVRQNVVKLFESDLSIADECDIKRIQSDDWFVQRFIEYYENDIEKAVHQLLTTLKWRKVFGVNSRQIDKDYGKEFFQIGALFEYNTDINNIPLLILRGKCNRKVPKLRPLIEMYIVAIIEQLDTKVGKNGFVFVLDCSDCGINNLSMDLLKFIITTLTTHYPLGMQYIIIYNLPWILRGIWKLVKGWLGEHQHMVHFANGQEIIKYVDTNSLPKYMGGNSVKLIGETPVNCPSVYELAAKLGFTEAEVRKYMKIYEDLLKESHTYTTN
ncbi:motile sperm domain-containing protein 2-like [Oppia nitens]|uniref:motile sperm domain-containing protein 2-like n=1 Tax=Oppia nitens TaxID=1686743 RepID=UPI0023DB37D4|nr:motile sperm domain-containing protein 2-like [Oppia nitens]